MTTYQIYDEADRYYEDSEFWPEGLDEDAASTHMGMFLAWAVLHGLASERHREAEAILAERQCAPGDYFLLDGGQSLTTHDFNAEGNAFADDCYDDFIGEYNEVFGDEPDQFFRVPDSWESYEKITLKLDALYKQWQGRPTRKLRRFAAGLFSK